MRSYCYRQARVHILWLLCDNPSACRAAKFRPAYNSKYTYSYIYVKLGLMCRHFRIRVSSDRVRSQIQISELRVRGSDLGPAGRVGSGRGSKLRGSVGSRVQRRDPRVGSGPNFWTRVQQCCQHLTFSSKSCFENLCWEICFLIWQLHASFWWNATVGTFKNLFLL